MLVADCLKCRIPRRCSGESRSAVSLIACQFLMSIHTAQLIHPNGTAAISWACKTSWALVAEPLLLG